MVTWPSSDGMQKANLSGIGPPSGQPGMVTVNVAVIGPPLISACVGLCRSRAV
jgi:hypothetical protein